MTFVRRSGEPPDDSPSSRMVPLERLAAVLTKHDIDFEYGCSDEEAGPVWLAGWWGSHWTDYSFFCGDEEGRLLVRIRHDGRWSTDHRVDLLEFCNTWNSKNLFPMLTVAVQDDALEVCAERLIDFDVAATDAQIVQSLYSVLNLAMSAFAQLDDKGATWRTAGPTPAWGTS